VNSLFNDCAWVYAVPKDTLVGVEYITRKAVSAFYLAVEKE
jgi:hypothetical protein